MTDERGDDRGAQPRERGAGTRMGAAAREQQVGLQPQESRAQPLLHFRHFRLHAERTARRIDEAEHGAQQQHDDRGGDYQLCEHAAVPTGAASAR